MVRRSWIERIYSAYSLEILRILLEHGREIAVVVSIVDHLDKNGFLNTVSRHEIQKHFRSSIVIRNFGSLREGKIGIVLPHVNVWI